MNTLLVKMGAASKKRSLLLLLLLAGLFNVANAAPIKYYTPTSGTLSLSSAYAVTGGSLYTNSAATTGATTTITSADTIVVQGTTFLTTNVATNVLATGGSLTVALGTVTLGVSATYSSTQTFTGAVIVGTSGSAVAGLTITANTTFNINGDLTIYNGSTVQLNSTSNSAGGAAVTVGTANGIGNLIMLGGTLNMSGNANTSFSGNLAGSADGQTKGWGLITGYQTNSYLYFKASANYGTGSATQTSATFTGTPVPQLINFTDGSGTTASNAVVPAIADNNSLRIQFSGYAKLVSNSVLPTASRIMSSTTTYSCIDLNGYSLAIGYIAYGASYRYPLISGGAGSGGNSTLQINGSSRTPGLGYLYVNQATGTNIVSLNMQMASATAANRNVQLMSALTLGSNSTFTNGIIYMNGQTVTAASFPAGSATSCIAEGVSATLYGGTGGGSVIVSSPSSTSITVPLAYSTATASTVTYTPITFANTTGSPASLTVGVAPLALANVVTLANCIPYQWTITSSAASGIASNITFGSTVTTGIGTTTTANSTTTSQLGVILSTNSTGYSAMTNNLANATSTNPTSSIYSATFAGYSLPANTNANTFVVGLGGSVYPFPTLQGISNTTSALSSPVNIALTGSNITSLTSSTSPTNQAIASGWLTVNYTNATSGSITGTAKATSSTTTITINAVNIAGIASQAFTYVEGNFPNITSSTSATALIGGTALSYTISTSSAANSFAISSGSLPSGLSLNTTSGVISGTPSAGTAGSYALGITATNTGSGLSNLTPFTLTLQVLDVPTVSLLSASPAGISPSTSNVDTTAFTLTVNGTNFVNGYSTVTWTPTGGSATNLTTTWVSATQLTASVPAALVSHNASVSTIAVGVTNAGTNASPTTLSSYSSPSTTTATYTITALTPTITAVSPAVSVAGAPTTIVTVTGTNFISGVSFVTFNGSTTGVTTTYVSATSLTATLSSTLLASAGATAIKVSNNGAGLIVPSTTSQTFTVYAAGALWPLTSNGAPVIAGANIASGSTLAMSTTASTNILPINTANVNTVFNAAPVTGGSNGTIPAGMRYTPSLSGTATTWTSESITVNSNFVGINSVDGASRYIQFDVTPQSGYNFTVNNIYIPFSCNTHTQNTNFKAAYSFDGFTTYTDIVGITGFVPVGTTTNFSYTTPIVVPDGKVMSVRIIPMSATNSSSSTITLANVVIGGTTSASYNSPSISSATTVNGDAAVTYTSGSPLYIFAASTESGHVPSYSATGLAGTGLSLDATTGAVTGTYISSSGGTFNATFKADNGNLFPTSTVITFNIAGKPLTPTVTSISPATGVVDGAGFTLTVNGTNFVSGKSAITWNGTSITTTYVGATQLTAAIPASYIAGSTITDNTITIGVYNTGADVPVSTVNQIYTITNPTPSVVALSPAGVVSGNADFTLTVYGSNFTTGSKITLNGSQLTTTFVNAFQLTATVAAANVATTGTKNIGVINLFPNGGSISTATTNSFIVGNAASTWSMASTTPASLGSIVASVPTLTNYTTSTNGNGVTYNEVFPGSVPDGSNSTADPTFAGLTTAPGSALVAAKSIDFKVTPADNTDMTISAISIPILVNGNGMEGVIGYSINGTDFTKISTATNTGDALSVSTVVNTNDFGLGNGNLSVTNYVFPTPISIVNGTTLTIRVIPWRKSSSANTVAVNIGPLTVIGNTTPQTIPDAPAISALSDGSTAVDVSFTAPVYTGTTAITSYKVYAYANGSATTATSASANVSSLTLPYHINVTGLTNGTSYTFKVSATNTAGEGALSAISTAVIPSNSTTWTITNGVGSWDHGDPDLGDQNAIINGNFTLTKALNCLKLTVASNVTVALGNFNFTVQGNLVNNGTISGAGTLLLSTTSAQTITGTGTVGNVTINNTSGGVSVTSGNMFNISGVLTLQRGALTTNSGVTFKSTSITNTGTLAAIDGVTNTGSISGTVIVERYIPAGYRGYRDLAPQVNNAGSIYNNWQEGGAFTSGKGIFITGPSATDANASHYATQPVPNSVGLDYSINGAASAFTYNNSNASFYSLYAPNKVDSIYNTTTINLYPFSGYRVLVRGDRSFNLATTNVPTYGTGASYATNLRMINATVLRSTGNAVTGTVTYATGGVTNTSVGSTYQSTGFGLNGTTNKFSMIANPYIAPIFWGTPASHANDGTNVYGASASINASYWYLDPTHSATGTYAAYNALTGSVYAGNTTSAYIQPGQAFFVQTSSASPSVVISETAKATSVAKIAVFGAATPLSKIYLSLLKQDATNTYNHVDAAAIAFSEGFTNATYGPQDAIKFGNNSDNLSISDKGKNLSIDGRLPATATDKIPVSISNVSGTVYQLDIDATSYTLNGFAPYLVDSYKGTTATLTSGLNSFKFTVDTKVAASFENRFSIVFKPTTLAVNSIVASATLNNKIATISWNTVGEKGVSRFEVEKSTDAKSFVKIGQASAKNTATATYTTTDNNTTAATNYYRIKAISEVGTVSYSNIAKLTNNSLLTTIYPNPLVGKTLNVSLTNVVAGKYTVTINNVLGQKVQEVAISHAGGSTIHAITVNNTLSAGTYSVTISESASGQLVHQTNLSVQP